MKREALGVAMVLSLAGCASLQPQDMRATEAMLTTAGFQTKMADTPEKLAQLQRLTPGKFLRREEAAVVDQDASDPGLWALWVLP